MIKDTISKPDGVCYGAIVGYVFGLFACIICRANHILFDNPTLFKMILLYATVLAIPGAIFGYAFPRTLKWVALVLSFISFP